MSIFFVSICHGEVPSTAVLLLGAYCRSEPSWFQAATNTPKDIQKIINFLFLME
jgi:hypothetical protein